MTMNGKYPEKICDVCVKKLNEIWIFIEKCRANQSLLEVLEDSVDIKSENIDQREYDDFDECHEFKLENETMKDDKFLCAKCSKSFATKRHLLTHIKRHSEVKPYNCLQCGLGFMYKQNLLQHKVLNKCVRSYECYVCKKGN